MLERAELRVSRLESRETRAKEFISELKEERDTAREGQQECYEEMQQMKMMLAR